jgi:CHAT domain-containing protein
LELGKKEIGEGVWSLNAREEALMVAGLFGTQAYVGNEATKSILKEKLGSEPDIDILHFACYSHFDGNHPLKSGITLAPEPIHNETRLDDPRWILTAEEIFGLQLRADLVTISSDFSGAGEFLAGEGLIGLSRALFYAGTPSMVVALMPVDDISTEPLMVSFYERLKQGDTKIEALQKAQLYLKSLTAAEAKAYYESKLSQLSSTSDTRRAQMSSSVRSVLAKLIAAEEVESHPVGMDYPIFNHPNYWMPFVLMGDWK